MRCKQAEKVFLRSIDRPLEKRIRAELEDHLAACPNCRAMKEDYAIIFRVLKDDPLPDMKPYFWQGLQTKLEGSARPRPLILWKGLGFKNIALVSMVLILVFTAIALLLPQKTLLLEGGELSQTEMFLWSDANPFQEMKSLYEQEDVASKNISLIFAELNGQTDQRRDLP